MDSAETENDGESGCRAPHESDEASPLRLLAVREEMQAHWTRCQRNYAQPIGVQEHARKEGVASRPSGSMATLCRDRAPHDRNARGGMRMLQVSE